MIYHNYLFLIAKFQNLGEFAFNLQMWASTHFSKTVAFFFCTPTPAPGIFISVPFGAPASCPVRTLQGGGRLHPGGCPHQDPAWPAPWPWASRTGRSECVVYKHPASGILLSQPERTETVQSSVSVTNSLLKFVKTKPSVKGLNTFSPKR